MSNRGIREMSGGLALYVASLNVVFDTIVGVGSAPLLQNFRFLISKRRYWAISSWTKFNRYVIENCARVMTLITI